MKHIRTCITHKFKVRILQRYLNVTHECWHKSQSENSTEIFEYGDGHGILNIIFQIHRWWHLNLQYDRTTAHFLYGTCYAKYRLVERMRQKLIYSNSYALWLYNGYNHLGISATTLKSLEGHFIRTYSPRSGCSFLSSVEELFLKLSIICKSNCHRKYLI